MDSDGILAFEKKVAEMLVGPFIDSIEHAQRHELVFSGEGLELGSTPRVARSETLDDGVELRVERFECGCRNYSIRCTGCGGCDLRDNRFHQTFSSRRCGLFAIVGFVSHCLCEQADDFVRHNITKKRLLAGLLPADLLNVEFFIVEEGASAVAFAILTVTQDDVILEMCGDRDPTGARVGAILQVLRARTPSEARPLLTAFLPSGWLPPQLEVESATEIREVMMIRPLRSGLLDRPLTEQDVLYWHGDMF